MTNQPKQFDVLSKLWTSLLSLITAILIGCFVFLWKINAFISVQQEINEQLKNSYKDISGRVQSIDDKENNNSNRITILEANNERTNRH